MLYTINQVYKKLYQRSLDVYDVFKNFFGEEYVDYQLDLMYNSHRECIVRRLQELGVPIEDVNNLDSSYEISDSIIQELEKYCSSFKVNIYVWWPNVTVTNDNGRSIHIRDLYAKVTVQLDGRIPYEYRGFGLNRATYTKEQFLGDYLHSHVPNIPKSNFEEFQLPCLGRGPIGDTILTLKRSYHEITWMLFCQELDMYVTVESLEGGPWKRLENIGTTKPLWVYIGYDDNASFDIFTTVFSFEQLQNFIKYYLEKGHLSLSFKEGNFCCGMPYYEYIIDISNAFIDFFNKYLKRDRALVIRCYKRNLLKNTIVANGKFHQYKDSNEDLPPSYNLAYYRNKKVLTFKGKDILTTITEEENSAPSDLTLTTVIDHKLAMAVLYRILRTINYRYRNEYYHTKFGSSQNATTYKKVCYI